MSTAGIRIRPAEEPDLKAILELERSVPLAPHWPLQSYAEILTQSSDPSAAIHRRLFIAFSDVVDGNPSASNPAFDEPGAPTSGAVLVGFSVGQVLRLSQPEIPADAELESVVVSPSVRRRGVGRALCGEIISWAREHSAETLSLEVRAENATAIALYRDLGFTEVARRAGYYSEPVEDAIRMQLTIPPAARLIDD